MKYALTGFGSHSSYYKYMADINRLGPDILGGVPRLSSLTALSVRNHLENGAALIDALPEKLFNNEDMMRQLIRIGFDRVHRFLSGGIDAWTSTSLPVEVSN